MEPAQADVPQPFQHGIIASRQDLDSCLKVSATGICGAAPPVRAYATMSHAKHVDCIPLRHILACILRSAVGSRVLDVPWQAAGARRPRSATCMPQPLRT